MGGAHAMDGLCCIQMCAQVEKQCPLLTICVQARISSPLMDSCAEHVVASATRRL